LVSTRDLAGLPEIDAQRALTQAMATLDAMRCPEWECGADGVLAREPMTPTLQAVLSSTRRGHLQMSAATWRRTATPSGQR